MSPAPKKAKITKAEVCEKDAPLSKFQRGIVQVYTGNGKGKPTAALR